MKIGYLDFLDDRDLGKYAEFHRVGRDMGASFSHVSLQGVTAGTDPAPYLGKWESILNESDVLIIRAASLPGDAKYLRMVRDALLGGKSGLFLASPNHVEKINPLLAHFEMTSTSLAIANISTTGHQAIIRFRREDDSLRNFELFAGVDTLTVTGPRVIYYGGNAFPIVVASSKQFVVNDGDLPTSDDPRQCACMTGWCGDKGQIVIAASGDFLHDPYHGPTGVHFPGITENGRFIRNLLGYYLKAKRHEPVVALMDGNTLCDSIEENLMKFVLAVLKSGATSGDWWTELVPFSIRKECAVRMEEEGKGYAREAYFNLIDLATIIDKNWKLFEPLFRKAMPSAKKADAIEWIQHVNSTYRRMAGHPLKRWVTGFKYSDDAVRYLRDRHDLTRRLVESAPPMHGDGTNS